MTGLVPPLRFIVYVNTRVGAGFLTHCLSVHPDIFCLRVEAFHSHSPLRYHLGRDEITKSEIIFALGGYYKAAGFKVNYISLPFEYMAEKGIKVIHLTRKNVLRATVSLFINRTHQVPAHSFQPAKATPIVVDIPEALEECQRRIEGEAENRGNLVKHRLEVLEVDYAYMVGEKTSGVTFLSEGETKRICKFLGVEPIPVFSKLIRTNPRPLSELVVNANELAQAAINAGYDWMLDEWMTT